MKRFFRILLNALTVLSFLLFVASVALWVLSHNVRGITWPDGRGDGFVVTGADTSQRTSGMYTLAVGGFGLEEQTSYYGPWEILVKGRTVWWVSALAHCADDGSIAVMAISGHATPLVPTGGRHITSNAAENSRAVPGMRLRPPRHARAVSRVRYKFQPGETLRGMTFHDVQRRLDTLLRNAGCRDYTARQALADAAECWREIRQDDIAHGGSGDRPFFNFVAVEGVGVFAVYGAGVEFYVVQGEEPDLRHHFDEFAMSEVGAARAVLAERFGRPMPDLVVEPSLSRAWLLSSGGGPAAG